MDILVQRGVDAKPSRVARAMFDPANDPEWIAGASGVEVLTPGPLGRGSKVRRDGGLLGRKVSTVTEVVRLEPERLLEMRYVDGPLKGGVTYEIERAGGGALVSIRTHGDGGSKLPGMTFLLKRSLMKDLDRLAAMLEPKRS